MRGRNWLGIGGAIGLLFLWVGAPAALAQANTDHGRPNAGAVERRPAMASFEGRSIDLAGDWGEARACMVWRQGGVIECFRTPEALEAREAELARRPNAPTATASYDYSCASPLRLYDYNYYGGRQLSFWDRGYWQNLWYYGFDNRTSSYIVGACQVYLADYADGWGEWYYGPTHPYVGVSVISWEWQNAISSIYIS